MSQTKANYPRVDRIEVTVPTQREGGLKYLLHRATMRLRILALALKADHVEEEVEAPPSRLGWDAVAGYFGETLEGYNMRRVGLGPRAPIGKQELMAALAAMGYSLTSTRVHLVVTHGYGRASR